MPGNILYKQRGTNWFPGDGSFMVWIVIRSPDHTTTDCLFSRAATIPSTPKCQAT